MIYISSIVCVLLLRFLSTYTSRPVLYFFIFIYSALGCKSLVLSHSAMRRQQWLTQLHIDVSTVVCGPLYICKMCILPVLSMTSYFQIVWPMDQNEARSHVYKPLHAALSRPNRRSDKQSTGSSAYLHTALFHHKM